MKLLGINAILTVMVCSLLVIWMGDFYAKPTTILAGIVFVTTGLGQLVPLQAGIIREGDSA
ncbi:hypothetical protein ACFQE1_02100 [Halobium palmae]|uniref:Uncharacterized protein n=1 Tax=Halobium palmae TaxID=1776492 RepID=A0ABD5RUZ6_9EURY